MSGALGKTAIFAALVLAATAASGQDQEQDRGTRLTVVVRGAEPGVGEIFAQLFDDEADYMRTPHAQARAAVDAEGRAVFVFEDLEPGDFALSVYYDEDGDGELDTGLFGVPREKFAFSNNAWGRFGPASWESARFALDADGAEIGVALRGVGPG
jgi:uncharacterized protein (DUF2141 family)